MLLEEGLLDEEAVQAVRRAARRGGVPFVVALAQGGKPPEAEVADAAARRLKLARAILDATFVELDAVREVPFDLAEERCLLPLSLDRSGASRVLRVAMADPFDAEAIAELESSTG